MQKHSFVLQEKCCKQIFNIEGFHLWDEFLRCEQWWKMMSGSTKVWVLGDRILRYKKRALFSEKELCWHIFMLRMLLCGFTKFWNLLFCSKIMVVGYQEKIKFRGGRILCCRWCWDKFIWYKKAFFSQHMNDGKARGPIEKTKLWSIISGLKLALWVIQNDKIPGWPPSLLSLVFRYVYCI